MRRATCQCGQLTAECDGEPLRVSVCHCLECQRRSGSAFAAQARFPREAVRVAGESREWSRTGDSGTTATFSFCPDCGSTVYFAPNAYPEYLIVALGAFADPDFPAPGVTVYDARKHHWVEITGEVEHLE